MTAPSARVRALTYERDGFACVSCGSVRNLEWNHRESSGHGGRGKKAPPLTPADGVTACTLCNAGFEHSGQARALALGHKLRRNRLITADQIPFHNHNTGQWAIPDTTGTKRVIGNSEAAELIEAAGGTRRMNGALL